MSVLPRDLWHYRPDARRCAFECFAQGLHCGETCWRTIDQSDDRRIPSAVQHLAQSDLQGTELAAARVRVGDDGGACGIDCGCKRRFVIARNYEDEISRSLKGPDCCGEESSLRYCLAGRPRKQGFIRPHT